MKTERETMAISEFKAKCLSVLARVQRTGTSVLVTRRGEPMALITPPGLDPERGEWLGSLKGTARLAGDVVSPASDEAEWEALR